MGALSMWEKLVLGPLSVRRKAWLLSYGPWFSPAAVIWAMDLVFAQVIRGGLGRLSGRVPEGSRRGFSTDHSFFEC